jgi:hypothetical protein
LIDAVKRPVAIVQLGDQRLMYEWQQSILPIAAAIEDMIERLGPAVSALPRILYGGSDGAKAAFARSGRGAIIIRDRPAEQGRLARPCQGPAWRERRADVGGASAEWREAASPLASPRCPGNAVTSREYPTNQNEEPFQEILKYAAFGLGLAR